MTGATERTEAAALALRAYTVASAARPPAAREFDIVDLLADLLELAEREGFDPRSVLAKAELHHRAEAIQRRLAA